MKKHGFIVMAFLCLAGCGDAHYLLHKTKAAQPRSFKRCGAYTLEECKQSLRTATEVAARCSYVQQRQCLMTFVETLSAIDDTAPFYSSAF